jgi:hypothetical protein
MIDRAWQGNGWTTERRATMTLKPLHGRARGAEGMVALENYVRESGLNHSLIDLVKTRASRGRLEI